jgi:hypothetical protein
MITLSRAGKSNHKIGLELFISPLIGEFFNKRKSRK